MPISLYNSLTRRTEPFAPLDPERVTIYLCGPTVYNYVHIGNARGPVVFDVLVRLLRRHYPQVAYARNITDVDDKINTAAQQQGVPIGTITERFAQAYREDMAVLGVAPPDIEPHATTHVGPIIAMIESLLDGGHAYAAEGHVLFDVGSFPAYGELSGRDTDELIAGSRVDVAPYKRSPGDFVLWKPSTPELPGWDSPWGRGRPGWHIECSAMSAAHLGETIDIHAGGIDLLFPHHENEIAQSTCAHGGRIFARWWMHNGMLTFDGRKMSKSLGNVLLLHELLKLHPPEALRLRLLSGHYRQPLDWSEAAIAQATSTLDGWYRVLRDLAMVELPPGELPVPERIEAALCDDLNTPQALAELSVLADAARQSGSAAAKAALLGGGALLGLLQQDAEAWFRRGESTVDAAHIEDLLQQRQAARAARDFARADAIRDELAAMHIAIEDSAQGTRWSIAKP
ncbi:cysteine--tRNA ligase [Rhodanobacter denitrificans]|uniref:Cysteine--tRNA ligase n=1 Tax=Rhodanobacter denitrificans TaxID=666685 RepID=I4WTM6_9GAMM|nr:cysteine--tRNA ligase [Rhodanobacter denitrificans]AGG88355.1 cysteinyl-tRNA synthetase [Rhodanobacter denitrificans]EIM02818.1 cysteinyl-tRNA ligase [Rhodanobacter denitrificans]UJM87496.1 cysteine--tRNA ligase [Rhodanobacter denitrificans]UJM89428.1 cysteine--tRNA ligase [Rhodanobacter denitrificans]